ncbi:MAG TPA: hypothetical protein VGM39_11275 [Kofleriaceae bacterium]|jgi:hypothetical protein
MNFFARAVVTGFALSLGSALFKRVAKQLGLDDEEKKDKDTATVRQQDGGTDPGLTHAPAAN